MAHYFLVTKQHNQIMNTHYSSYCKQCATSFHNIRCAKDISTFCSYMPSVHKFGIYLKIESIFLTVSKSESNLEIICFHTCTKQFPMCVLS